MAASDVPTQAAAARRAAPHQVVVTRPSSQLDRWRTALVARGFEPLGLPLIETMPATSRTDLDALFADWRAPAMSLRAILFVSPEAVRHTVAAGTSPGAVAPPPWQREAGPRCWAPGAATVAALVAAGVPANRIDQPPADARQFDSESLWPVVQGTLARGDRVWIVRGADAARPAATGNGRDWLARQLEARGVQVCWCVAYQRGLPHWTPVQHQQARRALADGSVWLFTSSEAVDNLARLLAPDAPAAGLFSVARALATHARVAARARAMGFGDVRVSTPRIEDIGASLESFS